MGKKSKSGHIVGESSPGTVGDSRPSDRSASVDPDENLLNNEFGDVTDKSERPDKKEPSLKMLNDKELRKQVKNHKHIPEFKRKSEDSDSDSENESD